MKNFYSRTKIFNIFYKDLIFFFNFINQVLETWFIYLYFLDLWWQWGPYDSTKKTVELNLKERKYNLTDIYEFIDAYYYY